MVVGVTAVVVQHVGYDSVCGHSALCGVVEFGTRQKCSFTVCILDGYIRRMERFLEGGGGLDCERLLAGIREGGLS